MGRKTKDHRNYKSILVFVNGRKITITLDKCERIKNKSDLCQLISILPKEQENKRKYRKRIPKKKKDEKKLPESQNTETDNNSINVENIFPDENTWFLDASCDDKHIDDLYFDNGEDPFSNLSNFEFL